MPNKNEKVLLTIAAAAGIGVTTFLFLRYRKKLANVSDLIFHDFKRPRTKFDLHIINNAEECDQILKIIREHTANYCILGFDCEWLSINNERRKVALLQLATAQGLCALFRLCKFQSIPVELRSILEDPDVIKTGVACNEDGKNLLQDYAIKVNGAFDLRFLALLANHRAGGLAKLSKSILDLELVKNWKITCSDWEAPTLTVDQLDYAAKDAFVAVEIFKKLYCTVRSTHDNASILQFCDNYTDISFKNKLAQLNLDLVDNKSTEKKLLNFSKKQKDIDKILKRAYVTRNKPLYDNCLLEAPDGELLCTIDRRKAEWYVRKGLGIEIEKEPLRVRLTFEPDGRAGETGEYYTTVKENCCVVCGRDNELIRKNVVPHEYRKFFPEVMKNKTSHDVLLLCTHCHHVSNMSDLSVRRKLEVKCNAPIYQLPENNEELNAWRKVQKSVKALMKSGNSIPEARKIELRASIAQAYPGKEINDEFLKQLIGQKDPEPLQKCAHGEIVVDYYRNNEGIIELEKMFRQHFLDVMQPKCMPKYWDINHNANRLIGRALENRVKPEDLKIAGVHESMIPAIKVTSVDSPKVKIMDEIDDDCVSVSSFYSAAGSVDNHSSRKMDQTDDERYFSDSTTIGSYYESCTNSVIDPTEFQSFEGSLKDESFSDSSTIGSNQDLSDFASQDSDTEVEDELEKRKE